jgi:hypothetical protein
LDREYHRHDRLEAIAHDLRGGAGNGWARWIGASTSLSKRKPELYPGETTERDRRTEDEAETGGPLLLAGMCVGCRGRALALRSLNRSANIHIDVYSGFMPFSDNSGRSFIRSRPSISRPQQMSGASNGYDSSRSGTVVDPGLAVASPQCRGPLGGADRLIRPDGLPFPRARVMSDILFLGIGLGFFAAACLYLLACDRL